MFGLELTVFIPLSFYAIWHINVELHQSIVLCLFAFGSFVVAEEPNIGGNTCIIKKVVGHLYNGSPSKSFSIIYRRILLSPPPASPVNKLLPLCTEAIRLPKGLCSSVFILLPSPLKRAIVHRKNEEWHRLLWHFPNNLLGKPESEDR